MRAIGLLLGACLALGACGPRYLGVSPSPYDQETCRAKGCGWNQDKAHCECWGKPNVDQPYRY